MMKKFLVVLVLALAGTIQAQRNDVKFPVFKECASDNLESLEQCFYDSFHTAFLKNRKKVSKNSFSETVETKKMKLVFKVDDTGHFSDSRTITSSSISGANKFQIDKVVKGIFDQLPQIRPAVDFENKPIDLSFVSDLIIDLSATGELVITDIKNTNVIPLPPPPPSMQIIEEITESEEILIEYVDIEEADDEIVPVPFAIIEKAPVYPGCADMESEADRKRCTTKMINEFALTEFNQKLAEELGLSGRVKITVQFTIDVNGNAVEIYSRARHPRLISEATRVIESLPQMIPGMQRGKIVDVIYALPIFFQVQD